MKWSFLFIILGILISIVMFGFIPTLAVGALGYLAVSQVTNLLPSSSNFSNSKY